MFIGLVCWIVIGLIAGLVVNKVIKLRGDDPKLGPIAGAAGAVVGGMLFGLFTTAGVTVFDSRSLLAAAAGALATLAAWHLARRASQT
jgi:uncharacterized membrane protein YeaQ/YmgE (transglycosylase-associated protein family)